MNNTFPDICVIKDFKYSETDEDRLKDIALADGLFAWALCLSGTKVPENFGYGMVAIGRILGLGVATHDNLLSYSRKHKPEVQDNMITVEDMKNMEDILPNSDERDNNSTIKIVSSKPKKSFLSKAWHFLWTGALSLIAITVTIGVYIYVKSLF